MNVKDLIEKLKTFPEDSLVLVQGYEGGYDDIIRLEEKRVIENPQHEDWYGKYDDEDFETKASVKSVWIVGVRK